MFVDLAKWKRRTKMETPTTRGTLVSSSDVNGTAVYARDGSHIGTIDHVMIDKQSGKVAYAVMGFGGFLGLGEDHYPIPWGKLSYDVTKEGFMTDITEAEVTGAPARGQDWNGNRDWERETHEYYRVPTYWM
jgi:sporulation protein YlmC with PRC-barrel domain